MWAEYDMGTQWDNGRMTRPCFLVIDREYAASISTRKLVIETAKMNVVTAYSGQEAIDTLKRFPAMDGAVIDMAVPDVEAPVLVHELKSIQPGLPVIVITVPRQDFCDGADYVLPSFDPAKLLELLKSLEPVAAAAIEQRDEDLAG